MLDAGCWISARARVRHAGPARSGREAVANVTPPTMKAPCHVVSSLVNVRLAYDVQQTAVRSIRDQEGVS
jgi:hypothetical protein